jgi:alkylated DNA repair protein (DNA oxidative demethylase)
MTRPTDTFPELLPEDVIHLRSFVIDPGSLLQAIEQICDVAPLRRMRTPGGRWMSAEMSNCGTLGWVSDEAGYRYVANDPLSGHSWPTMPTRFSDLAAHAAQEAGFGTFFPDACLINCYRGRAQMGAHRDADERDFSQPIVSVSLVSPAQFLWYGLRRAGKPVRIVLEPGDVLVWGRSARKGYHAVQAPQGPLRYNLTFRRAG